MTFIGTFSKTSLTSNDFAAICLVKERMGKILYIGNKNRKRKYPSLQPERRI